MTDKLMDILFLKKLGFTDKTAEIYLALLKLGPSSVRKLAEFCELNRGTTYDALKWLQDTGIVSFYRKESKQHFVAESPEKLHSLVRRQKEDLEKVDQELNGQISELQALHNKGGEKPVARYYEKKEIVQILVDVLNTCEAAGETVYRIYSAEGLRKYLYEDFSTFSDVRISRGISVKAIAVGEGGELRGLDERKFISKKSEVPTYIIIYPGKTAYISLNAKKELVGVVIENEGVFQTQCLIFDQLWELLISG
jgi:sugar-specific transcriptional regulator TrmB